VPDDELEPELDAEHQVTPLELFFDLVFVFALTQVTTMLADDPTWSGVLRGMLVLAALWWAWAVYAWLTSATDVDEGGDRLAMLASTAAMLIVALTVPGAFGYDAADEPGHAPDATRSPMVIPLVTEASSSLLTRPVRTMHGSAEIGGSPATVRNP
jgi:Bacterial low temperature requirement A protein (LtrA)